MVGTKLFTRSVPDHLDLFSSDTRSLPDQLDPCSICFTTDIQPHSTTFRSLPDHTRVHMYKTICRNALWCPPNYGVEHQIAQRTMVLNTKVRYPRNSLRCPPNFSVQYQSAFAFWCSSFAAAATAW